MTKSGKKSKATGAVRPAKRGAASAETHPAALPDEKASRGTEEKANHLLDVLYLDPMFDSCWG